MKGAFGRAFRAAALAAPLLLLPGGPSVAQPAGIAAEIAAVTTAAPAALQRHNAIGAAVAIVHGGEVVWSGGFGLADPARGIPVTADTVFETASVSKPVTAWAILRLAEQRRINLDAPIADVVTRWTLPPSNYDNDLVTARRILAHAAGLSTGGDPGVEPGDPVPTLIEILDGAGYEGGRLHVATEPGTAYHYSSKGYSLLELAVEEITGDEFAAYMEREILRPLRMTSSAFHWTEELRARAAVGHDWFGNPLPLYDHATKAQGGLVATAGDVARFVAATMRGPNGEPPGRGVISPESVTDAFAPVPYSADPSLVGLGYNLYTSTGTLVARKTGDHRGWKSIVFLVPAMGAGIVIFSNSDRAAAGVFADIACPWSNALGGDPLRDVCGQLYAIRNVHLGVAAAVFAVFLLYGGWVAASLARGRRQLDGRVTAGRMVRLIVVAAAIGAWWVFWYTDTFLTWKGFAPTSVTVRLDPWPTAFIWIAWAVTLLLLALAASTFAPKRSRAGR